MQVASIIPSSKALVRKVSGKMDLSKPRIIAEYGPGEGVHTREIVRRMHPESRLLLFELDPELATHLEEQFKGDERVIVLNTDAQKLSDELAKRSLPHCDYVVSGIPFSILEIGAKRELLRTTYEALVSAPHAAFIIYQVTNELRERGHCDHFARAESEYCLQNIPPMFVTKFYKIANGVNGNGHSANGNGKH
jgi:phosphatidylethanolamine/phosphatidyl-N-methylethanolamine N-methyltransferase